MGDAGDSQRGGSLNSSTSAQCSASISGSTGTDGALRVWFVKGSLDFKIRHRIIN